MAKCFIQDTTLTAIGDAIRAKTGRTDLMLPSAMPDAIAGIVSGGGSGDYIWSIQHSVSEASEDKTAGTYALTAANRPSSEIEYTNVVSDWRQSNKTSGDFNPVYYSNGIWVAGSKGLYYSTDGMTWTQSNVTSGDFRALYYANGIWVAGDATATVGLQYSTDGMTWTQSNMTGGFFKSVYYANGIWVACSSSPYYSTDGITWTKGTGSYASFESVYYGNGIWVGADDTNGLYYSTDGMTWNHSDTGDTTFNIVYYNNEIWVAGAVNNGLAYSTDGINWNLSSINVTDTFKTVYYANGLWVAGGDSKGLYYSIDGMTWTQSNITSGSFRALYYANKLWVAGGVGGLYYSTDGMTWTESNETNSYFWSVYYGNGIWVGAGSNGLYYMSVGEMTFNTETKTWEMSNSTVATLTNTDGTVPTLGALAYVRLTSEPNVWYLATSITAGSSSPYSKTLAYDVKYTAALDVVDVEFIADDDSMKYPDGGWLDGLYYTAFDVTSTISDWVQSNVTRGFMSVYYANGVWVAGCTGTKGLYYSTDGMTWTQSNVTSVTGNSVYYANGIWVAGSGKGLYYSTDGMTWTQSNVTYNIF